jgi:4a-hydroxytetrahydrobiopterin dehydratase
MICSSTQILTEEEIRERLTDLGGWSHVENRIEKKFQFKSFVRAISFVNAVAYIAEAMNHHPDITIHYNQVTLMNWTHATGGITEYDLALAAKIEGLVSEKTTTGSG